MALVQSNLYYLFDDTRQECRQYSLELRLLEPLKIAPQEPQAAERVSLAEPSTLPESAFLPQEPRPRERARRRPCSLAPRRESLRRSFVSHLWPAASPF